MVDIYNGHDNLACMMSTHVDSLINILTRVAKEDTEDDTGYIEHEIRALEHIREAIAHDQQQAKLKTAIQKLHGCLGYVENGTSVSISISQDDATGYYCMTAVDTGTVLWQEYESDLDLLIRAAYEKHAEKF